MCINLKFKTKKFRRLQKEINLYQFHSDSPAACCRCICIWIMWKRELAAAAAAVALAKLAAAAATAASSEDFNLVSRNLQQRLNDSLSHEDNKINCG